MGYSCKIYFRKNYIRKDGTCAIYLQVIVDRKKKVIPLDLYWPAEYCSDNQDLCRPIKKNDQECDDVNIMLRDQVSKANKIFKYYRLSGDKLTMDRFMEKWEMGQYSNADFLEYFERIYLMRFQHKDFGIYSYKRYKVVLNMLKSYKKKITFSDLNEKWAYNFDNYLKRKIKARSQDTQNTRWGYHKYIKVILNHARAIDNIKFVDPYKYFSISQKRGKWPALQQEDVNKLYQYYLKSQNSERVILRRFLFGCATSLRISDLQRVQSSWKNGDALEFEPQKTAKKTGKRVKIPLSKFAMIFWNDALREKGDGMLFNDFEPQHSNRVLKKIAEKLDIKVNIHNHVSRHTFTTLFLNNGGSLRAAQRILAHASVQTTEKYDHMNYHQLVKELDKMEFVSLS